METESLEDVAANLADEMPKPSGDHPAGSAITEDPEAGKTPPSPVDSATEKSPESMGSDWEGSGLRDPQEWRFHPDIHEKNRETGLPRLFHGKLKRKKGWLKAWERLRDENGWSEPWVKEEVPEIEEPFIPEEAKEPEAVPVDAVPEGEQKTGPVNPGAMFTDKALAGIITSLFLSVGIKKFGKEWEPRVIDADGTKDIQEVEKAFEYWLSTVGKEPPPWAVPIIACAGYGATRALDGGKVASGFVGWFHKASDWMKLRFAWLMGWFSKGKKAKPSPPPAESEE